MTISDSLKNGGLAVIVHHISKHVEKRTPSMGNGPQGQVSDEPAGRLESWKEIAAYLGRQIRTINLWEKTEGLPVHRHLHKKRGTVYAFKSELNEWRRQRAALHPRNSHPGTSSLPRFKRIMIAVLPFANLTGDSSHGYFSDGLTEEIISQLGRLRRHQLGVIARTSSTTYKISEKSIATIGRELAVDYVVEGSVRRCVDRVRITARLVNIVSQLNVWFESYDRHLADIFVLQTEVAARIAGSVAVKLFPERSLDPPVHPATLATEVHEVYLKADQYWNQYAEENLLDAIHYFSRAMQKDPQLASAYSGFADAYNLLSVYGVLPPRGAIPVAKAVETKALGISAEAHEALADVRLSYDWEWDASKEGCILRRISWTLN
jgi:TolB-like protein